MGDLKMKKEIIIILVLMLLLSSFAVADDILVSPELVDLDLVAGDNHFFNITINAVKIGNYHIITAISPDGLGINVTYSSGEYFYIGAVGVYHILMTINTSMLLIPDVYTFVTEVFYETSESNEGSGGSSGGENNGGGNPPPYNPTAGDGVPDYDDEYNSDDGFPNVVYYTNTPDENMDVTLPVLVFILSLLLAISSFYLLSRKKEVEK